MDPTTCPKCLKAIDDAPNFCPGCGADLRGMSPVADTYSGPWAGKIIDGRYKLLEKLGEGGMGSVFRVEHVRMG
ncbi:MAG: serine/threonine-protein kinase, partial [Myxococcaceae bacterium]